MKVYISGKIGETVVSEATRKKYAEAQHILEEEGLEVFNPTSEEWQTHLIQGYGRDIQQTILVPPGRPMQKYDYFLLRDLMALASKDSIYMLKDWTDSLGARAEHAFAEAIGLEVMYEEPPVDISIRDIVAEMVDAGEQSNAGKCFVKYEKIMHRDWDLIITVRRHKEKE